MEIQDGKGNALEAESLWATIKQWFCFHNWIKVGYTYECPKCLSINKIHQTGQIEGNSEPKEMRYYDNQTERCPKCEKLIYMGRTTLHDNKLCCCKFKIIPLVEVK